jgi:hypothetical protein
MPSGTGAVTLQNIPASPFVTDPSAFFQMTEKNVITPKTIAAPGQGSSSGAQQILQTGVVSKLQITFVGTLTVATAAVTTGDRWPHGLLSGFRLSANGENDLYSCDGVDLHALRFARYPAYVERVDIFPDVVGGGGSVAVGTYNLSITWEVPIAMDDVSLVGSLFAQSSATNLTIWLTQALNTDLFTANPANATIAGTFYVQETFFEIPFDGNGRMVLPDLTRLHGFNVNDVPYTNTGPVRTTLVRSAGQLSRLFVSVRKSATARLSALPNAAAANKIDALTLQYGGNQNPLVFDPASTLLSLNNQWYGAPLPYDRLSLDFVKENPPRDVVLMQGVTELAAIPKVNSAVTVTAGVVRVAQETLF